MVETLSLQEVLDLPVYKTANIFPMLINEAEQPAGSDSLTIIQFAEQIHKEGIRDPLVIWNGQLIDGRNRREAARIVEKEFSGSIEAVPVRYADFVSEEEADAFILAAALDRRSMNKDQLACAAVRYGWEIEAERSKDRMAQGGRGGMEGVPETGHTFEEGKTRDFLARRFHVGKNKIQDARSLYMNDRARFTQVADGRQRIQGTSPGQNVEPEAEDVVATALKQLQDGLTKFNGAVTSLADKAGGESREKAIESIQAKLEKMVRHFNDQFKTGV